MQAHGVVVSDWLEQLTAIIQLEERQIAAWGGCFKHQALRVTTGSQHTLVQRRLRPAGGRLEVQVLVTFFVNEVEDLVDGVLTGLDFVLLNRQAEGQTRGFADRVTDTDTCTQAVDRIAGHVDVKVVVVSGAIEGVVTQADAIGSPVGVNKAEVVAALVFTAGQTDGDLVTGTEEVGLADRTTEDQTGALGETDAGGDRTGSLFFNAVVDVDLVVGARYGRGLDVDFLEEAQALQTGLGLVDQVGRSPAAFHLAHFAAQHFVFGLGVATEVDTVDVGTLARIDHEGDVDGVILVVWLWHAVDVGEGVAFVAQTTGDQLGGGGHHFTREHLARLHQHQRLDLVFRHLEVAGEFHVTNGVLLTFVDVDSNVDVLLVRGDRHLGGSDVHVDVAAVQVVGTQTLQVTGEFFTGVLVIVLEERQPVGGLELEQADQVFVREDGIADHVDVLDGSDGAFVDLDLQADAVARLRHHFSLDLGRVAALGNVLALQFVTHTFEGGALEDFAFGQTRLLQTFHQVFSADGLVAFDLDAGHRRTLDHGNDQDVTVTAQLDILKETGLEQCTGGVHQATVIGLIADVQWQSTENAARGNPLQTIDTNIGDGEGLGVNFSDHQYGENRS
ncbi:hypothetical protein D3C77_185620 [compost metagenome]